MKKKTFIIYLVIVALLLLSVRVMAANESVELVGSEEIEANTSQTMEIKIPDSSDAIGSIGGTIETTNITIENVEAMNGFTVHSYNRNNGKFVATNADEDVKGKSIIKITYKLDSGKTNGKIIISEIKGANSIDYKEIPLNSVEKSVRVAESDPIPEKPIQSISLSTNATNDSVPVGKTIKIVTEFNPEDTTDSKALTYSSADETIATVDANGNVKGIKEGTTIITVTTSNGKTAQITITVTKEGEENPKIEIQDQKQINKDDKTIANGKIPQTGEKSIIGIAIIVLLGVIIFLRKKNKDLKEI